MPQNKIYLEMVTQVTCTFSLGAVNSFSLFEQGSCTALLLKYMQQKWKIDKSVCGMPDKDSFQPSESSQDTP